MITRKVARAAKPVELSSNTESSDDDFQTLSRGSDDEDVNASKQGDGKVEDEWMYRDFASGFAVWEQLQHSGSFSVMFYLS